ncbi:centromere protein Q [Erinaceus europaeus]|uniref:Centromere protein Q n=1 Tax=Erinaceus europaeus TaxID=9365 RepID=A0ABM3X7B2_ERIEU|nr:centromere protein Q [Erinaceus europaeus]
MPRKSSTSKKSQQLKRNPKRKMSDSQVEFSEEEVRNTVKKTKNPRNLPSEESLLSPETGHSDLKRVRIPSSKRKTWKPLSQNSKSHFRGLMESVIIAVLSKKIKEGEQIQHHLNSLKRRLLQLCETLDVPPQKLEDVGSVSDTLKMEHAQLRTNEESLKSLQEEIDKIVETTESMTRNIQNLTNEIQILTSEVEEEDKNMKQLFQIDSSGELYLPELYQRSLKAPTLQDEILALIPNKNTLLKDINTLHNSPQARNVLTFIEEAYKKLDGM